MVRFALLFSDRDTRSKRTACRKAVEGPTRTNLLSFFGAEEMLAGREIGSCSGPLTEREVLSMKSMTSRLLVLVAVLGLPLFPGCGEKGAQQSPPDTSQVEKSFQNAEPDLKTQATRAIEAVKAGNYQGALTELQGLLGNVKLTADQKNALTDLINKVKDRLASGLKDATKGIQGGAEKLGEGLKDLGK